MPAGIAAQAGRPAPWNQCLARVTVPRWCTDPRPGV